MTEKQVRAGSFSDLSSYTRPLTNFQTYSFIPSFMAGVPFNFNMRKKGRDKQLIQRVYSSAEFYISVFKIMVTAFYKICTYRLIVRCWLHNKLISMNAKQEATYLTLNSSTNHDPEKILPQNTITILFIQNQINICVLRRVYVYYLDCQCKR